MENGVVNAACRGSGRLLEFGFEGQVEFLQAQLWEVSCK